MPRVSSDGFGTCGQGSLKVGRWMNTGACAETVASQQGGVWFFRALLLNPRAKALQKAVSQKETSAPNAKRTGWGIF